MTGQTTALALPASTDEWARAVSTHPTQFAIVAAVALAGIALTGWFLTRASRRVKDAAANSDLTAERVLTLVTSAIASVVAAQGMFSFFTGIAGMPKPLVFATFAFIELMVVASAMRARRSQIDTGSGGVDGIAMWVLTILSGVLAATHAATVGEWLLRLIAPLVAAWGWERSMALERRKLTGKAGGMNWRISPQRLLVRWGITDPTDRTTAEVAIERRLADLARAADSVRLARTTSAGDRAERRALRRLHRAIDKATDDGVVLGETSVRDRLTEHLEGRFSAYTLPEYQPSTDWADLTRVPSRPLAQRAPREETGSAMAELEREFLDRAPRAELTAASVETAPEPQQPPALGQVQAPALESDTVMLAEYERELAPRTTPAPEPALAEVQARTWATAPEESAGFPGVSADPALTDAGVSAGFPHQARTYVQEAAEPAPHQESAGSAGSPHQRIEPAADTSHQDDGEEAEQVTEAAPARTSAPAPARTFGGEVPAPATARTSRPHPVARTTPAPAPALSSGAGPRTSASAGALRAALALAPEQSAGLVRGDATELAHEVRARRIGQRMPFETVVRVLEMLAADETPNAIHAETKVHHKTIGNIRDTALRIHAEAAGRTSRRGQVIELRKPERQ
ncbi:hypothetical protein [Nocardia yamanashiensis]|uniref:hypothetical protein n=1 Tax=Nocardia yamanashiensis TaxID=209247 RepID=UPI00083754D4|nr:hypothetical protein [Nocardia yamanashiensis]